jgi:hypothetical protein
MFETGYTSIAESRLDSQDVELFLNPKTLRKALHLFARNLFHKRNLRYAQGEAVLRIIFFGGETEAGIDAAAAEIRRRLANIGIDEPGTKTEPLCSPQVFTFIKTKALQDRDPRALTIYLDEMHRSRMTLKITAECYQLAKELNKMHEASKQTSASIGCGLDDLHAPWKILYDAAEEYRWKLQSSGDQTSDTENNIKVAQEDMERAIRDGLYNYKDMRAVRYALKDPNILRRGSKPWINFATIAASKGDKDAASAIAWYYLEKDGWQLKKPEKMDLSTGTPTAPTSLAGRLRQALGFEMSGLDPRGIEWLAVSAASSVPNTNEVANKFVGLAYLLREHGQEEAGLQWLKKARAVISDAGLDPSQFWDKEINSHAESWEKEREERESGVKGARSLASFVLHSSQFLDNFMVKEDTVR